MILRRVGSFWHDGAVVCLLGTIVRLFPSLANLNALEKKKLKWITDGVYSKKSMARVGLNVDCIPRWCSEKWQFFSSEIFLLAPAKHLKGNRSAPYPCERVLVGEKCLVSLWATRNPHDAFFVLLLCQSPDIPINFDKNRRSHEVSVWLTILTLLSSSW